MMPTHDRMPRIVQSSHTQMGRPPVPGLGGPGPGSGMTGRDIMRILRKRIWLILLTTVIVSAVSVVATWIWLMTAPFYTTSALLQVSPPRRPGLAQAEVLATKDVMQRILMREAQMVKTESVLGNATEDPELRNTRWFKKFGSGEIIQEMVEEIHASPMINTDLIKVSMTMAAKDDRARQELAAIVNAVADAYVDYSDKHVRRDRDDRVAELLTERKEIDGGLTAVRSEMTYQQVSDIPGMQQHNNVLAYELQMLTAQMIELEGELSMAQASLMAFQEMEQQGMLAGSGIVQQFVDMDLRLRTLYQQRVIAQTALDDAEEKFGLRHKRLSALRNQVDSMDRQIAARIKEVAAQSARSVMRQAQSAVDGITGQMVQVQARMDTAKQKLSESQETLGKLAKLTAEEENLLDRMYQIDQALDQARVQARGERRVVLAHPATTPRKPSMPRWQVMIPLGTCLGAMLGFGLAFLLEVIDTSVKSPADVTRRIELPVLGMVPHIDDLEEEIEHLPLAFVTNPKSLISEAFRQIRTCLLFSGPPARRRSILITSPMPEDGRTTVTMNLAGAIAGAGKRVLVVDANFRQPVMHKFFPRVPEAGLSSALAGQHDWRDLVMELDSNLYIMGSGTAPPNPTELLGSEQMRAMLAEMVEQYDQVLLKGTPCLVVSDSIVLSTLVDGVILVVRAGANTYGIVQRARDGLKRVGARILGVVLNGVRHTAGGYYREAYETFYDYHVPEKLPVAAVVGESEDDQQADA